MNASWVDWGPFWQAVSQPCLIRDNQARETAEAAAAKFVERIVSSAGCPVVIALLPSRLMTHEADAVEQVNRVGGAVGVDAARAASLEAELTRNFLDLSAQRTCHVIDLTTTVAGIPNTYFPIDWHLSERGHEVIGKALVAKVAAVLERR